MQPSTHRPGFSCPPGGCCRSPSTMLLALLKPDVITDGNTDAALSAIEEEGFTIIQQDLRMLTLSTAKDFYQEHRGKDFFEEIVQYLCRTPARLHDSYNWAGLTASAPQWSRYGAAALQTWRCYRPHSVSSWAPPMRRRRGLRRQRGEPTSTRIFWLAGLAGCAGCCPASDTNMLC
eukprot:69464_2